MSSQLSIHLSKDEALVLLEFFARFSENGEFCLRNNAEFVAFARVSSELEKALVQSVVSTRKYRNK